MVQTEIEQKQPEAQPKTAEPELESPQDNKAQPEQVEVPDRPALAPNIELSGEMQESGFEKKQYLVQREGTFKQLPELLYSVLEQVNGQRTLEEIAEAASQRLNRDISADNVRKIIATKLIPQGLVVKADGSVEQMAGEKEGAQARSPLAVNMKMKMISPRFIEPFTNVLQHLYHPPVLILLLVVSAVIHGWFYFIHGVANGIQDVLYTPGLMLALLGIILVSTLFHEFGHAAALQYGGGRVRGMGAGLYIVYPAFFTDVTDNYRLKRWARVRTDAGGFYFNLIFEMALLGIYMLTQQEFLLLCILLIDLDIVHQLLPFVRLDGYWILADMTGVPDFFSQIGPFLRSVLPIPGWKGNKLPPLKGWVKFVFGLYILITIPLLVILLFLMIKGAPRVIATTWDSLQKQVQAFTGALSSHDIPAIVVAVLQIILLVLPTLGLGYSLFSLARRGMTALWNWSKPTPGRRAIGALVTLGVAGFFVFLWLPQIPFFNKPGPSYEQLMQGPLRRSERGTLGDLLPVQAMLMSVLAPNPAPEVVEPTPLPDKNPAPGSQYPPVVNTPVPVIIENNPPAAATPQVSEPQNGPAANPPANPNTLPPTLPAVNPPALPNVPAVVPTVEAVPGSLVPTVEAVPGSLVPTVEAVPGSLVPTVEAVPGSLVPTVEAVPGSLVPTVEAVPGTLIPTVEAVPGAVPTVIQSVPNVVPTTVNNAPAAVQTTVPNAVPPAVATAVPQAVPTKVPQVVATAVPQAVPTKVPQVVPTAVPQVVPTKAPQIIPTAVPLVPPKLGR